MQSVTTTMVSSTINSFTYSDEAGFGFSSDAFNSGIKSGLVGAAGSMTSTFTSGLLGTVNLGEKAAGFTGLQTKDIQRFNAMAGSFAGQGVEYALGGNFTLNVLNLSMLGIEDRKGNAASMGLLEMRFGREGFGMALGTGGADVSLGTIAAALGGGLNWGVGAWADAAAKRDKVSEAATGLRAQWGFGDAAAKGQMFEILLGKTRMERGSAKAGAEAQTVIDEETGKRTVVLNGYKDGMTIAEQLFLGVTLQHEAYRDTVVDADNYLETREAALAHTEMALGMAGDPLYAGVMLGLIVGNENLRKDLGAYFTAKDQGDMSAFNSYVDNNYDSSADYWKLLVEINKGRLDIKVEKDQETDTLEDLARRISGESNGEIIDLFKELLSQGAVGNILDLQNLQNGDAFNITGLVPQTMNFREDGTRLFQNSGLPEFLDGLFPDVGYTSVRLHGFNLPDEENANAWPNNTIGVGDENHELWMRTLNTLAIAKQYGFNLDTGDINLQNGIAYILHENFHLEQFKQLGALGFTLRYIPEYNGWFGHNKYFNYDYDKDNFMSKQLSYQDMLNDPAGKFATIYNPNLTTYIGMDPFFEANQKPSRSLMTKYNDWLYRYNSSSEPFLKVYTTLDLRADAFGYGGYYDYKKYFKNIFSR
jgi:hypothetical protein